MATAPDDTHATALVSAAMPVAAAIGVFGVIYGAAARPVIGTSMTVLSSLLVFSGAAQFTMAGLLAAGAAPAAVLGAVSVLALRHVPLGAVLRPRMSVGRGRRAVLAWLLIDETAGLALARDDDPERTLAVSGGLTYTAWVVGTALGVAGADVRGIEPVATAVFPVLFVGLAALTARTRSDTVRALLAGLIGLALLLVVPSAGALGAIAVAVAVASVVRAP